jgi:hypothetical protein
MRTRTGARTRSFGNNTSPSGRRRGGRAAPPFTSATTTRIVAPRLHVAAIDGIPVSFVVFAIEATSHLALIPHSDARSSRPHRPIPATPGPHEPALNGNPAHSRSTRKHRDRPVTPEVAGPTRVDEMSTGLGPGGGSERAFRAPLRDRSRHEALRFPERAHDYDRASRGLAATPRRRLLRRLTPKDTPTFPQHSCCRQRPLVAAITKLSIGSECS